MIKECTISTHIGDKVAQAHNRRDPKVVSKEPHIKNSDGAFSKTILDRNVHEVYHELFDDAVKEYNAKQKRADRKIHSYYEHIKKDKTKKLRYEMIVGVYGVDDAPLQKKILSDFVKSWHQRNPNMYLTGIYLHHDEDSNAPHLHIDYIPVSKLNKRGLSIKNSLNLALDEMGFKASKKQRRTKDGKTIELDRTPLEAWTRANNDYLEKLCIENGLTVKHPDREKAEQGIIVKHEPTQAYKRKKLERELYDNKKILENIDKITKQKEILANNHIAINKQIETWNYNQKIIKNQVNKALEPSEKEILEDIKVAHEKEYLESKNYVKQQKAKNTKLKVAEEEIEVDDDFGLSQ